MDYGRQNQNSQAGENPFFTAGVGNAPVSANNFEPENNIDLTNPAGNWRMPIYPNGHGGQNAASIGQNAISASQPYQPHQPYQSVQSNQFGMAQPVFGRPGALAPTPGQSSGSRREAIFSAESVMPATPVETANPAFPTNIANTANFIGTTSAEPYSAASNSPELGVIMDTMPAPSSTPHHLSPITSDIRPQGDHLSDRAVQAIDSIVGDFRNSIRPLSDTYDEAVAAREAYLKNIGFGGSMQ